MDFEFVIDLTGQPLARCEMESENFGDWLSHDIGTNRKLISTLLEAINNLQHRRVADYTYTGKIYHLSIADEEVELFLNNSELADSQFEDEVQDGTVAGCGLEELKHLLESWQDFTGSA